MIPQESATNQITLTWSAPYKGDTNLSFNIYYAPRSDDSRLSVAEVCKCSRGQQPPYHWPALLNRVSSL